MVTEVDLAREFVGKPFAWHGRGPAAYDCWGLVRACLLRAGVCNVPDYRSATEGAANASTILDAMADGWTLLPAAEPGCVVLFRMDRRAGTHVGYMLTRDTFLHVMEETRAVVERISLPLWKHRVIGFYRWKGQA
jgi:cell wall-associated NlpC family hydrolase